VSDPTIAAIQRALYNAPGDPLRHGETVTPDDLKAAGLTLRADAQGRHVAIFREGGKRISNWIEL
jgi:hypothetical protein